MQRRTFTAFGIGTVGAGRRAFVALGLVGALAGCGGGGDGAAEVEAAVAAGNAGQIRKEYQVALAMVNAPRAGRETTAGAGSVRTAALADPVDDTVTDGAAEGVTAAATALPPDDPIAVGFRDDALAALNQARSVARRCGDREMPAVGPVAWDARVAYAALLESEWMLSRNAFDHAWENGELVWDRLMMAGYLWQAADENIAAGFNTLDAAMQAWLESPAHCVALMRADIEDAGIAVLPGHADSRYSSYWTMALGTRKRVAID